MSIHVECGECFDTYDVPEKYAGRKIKCKACGGGIRVPRPGEASADDLEFAEEPVSRRPAPPARRRSRKSSGRSTRRKANASGFPVSMPLMIGGGVLLSLFGLSFVVPFFGFILMIVLLLGGIACMMLGFLRSLVTAFQEGALPGLACFFCFPLFALFAIISDPQTYARHVLTWLLGICLLGSTWAFSMFEKARYSRGLDEVNIVEQPSIDWPDNELAQTPPAGGPPERSAAPGAGPFANRSPVPHRNAMPGQRSAPRTGSPSARPQVPARPPGAGTGSSSPPPTVPSSTASGNDDPWTRGTRPLPADAALVKGQYVMVREGAVKYYPSEVLEVIGPDQVKIHYYGWSATFDEVVARERIRLPHQADDVADSDLVTVEFQIVRYMPRGRETLEASLRSRLGYIADSVKLSDDKTRVSFRAIRGSDAEKSARIAFARVGIVVR